MLNDDKIWYKAFMLTMTKSNLNEFYIDIKNNTYHAFKTSEYIKNILPEDGDWYWLKRLAINSVDDSFKNVLSKKFSKKYLAKHLSENEDIEVECAKQINNQLCWFRITALLIDKDKEDKMHHIMIMVKNITKEISSLQSQQIELNKTNEKLMESLEITKSLSNIYFSVNYIDLDRKTCTPIKNNQHILRSVPTFDNIQQSLYDIINKFVAYDSLEEMMIFMNLSTLKNRIGHSKSVSIEFASKYIGWCRATFISAGKDKSNQINHVLLVIQVIENERKISYLAKYDALTGLRNRNYIYEDILKIEKTNQNYCIIIGDIDDFKKVNDKYGHRFGDQILEQISEIFKVNVSSKDICCRWGGEEILLLIQTNKSNALKCLECIRSNINDISKSLNMENTPISMTFGMAERKEANNFDDALILADKRLYYGKGNNKNIIIDQ